MKITAVETYVCNARMRNWVLIKVVTDEPGLWGWGEATLEWHTRAVVGAVQDLADLIVGEDPTRVEHLWQIMFRQHFWHGNDIVRGTALSGIDIALWDIVGKHLGVPCHQLWGGAVRDYIRLYCHLGGGRLEDFYETPTSNAARFAELALAAVDEGYTAMKCMAVAEMAPIEGMQRVREAEQCVGAMRDAVGPDIDLMVDCHARLSPAMGMRVADVLEPFDLYFLEEPCWPESVEGLAAIQRSTSTPIASGERLVSQHAFRPLVEQRAVQVLQPDITHCGGLSEARRIAGMAEAYRLALAPHNPQGPISTAASIELGFATPSYVICESVHADVPWRDELVSVGYTVQEEGRLVRASTRPGLGVEVDEAVIARHPFQPELPQRSFHPDGSVADW